MRWKKNGKGNKNRKEKKKKIRNKKTAKIMDEEN